MNSGYSILVDLLVLQMSLFHNKIGFPRNECGILAARTAVYPLLYPRFSSC
jgi:hypothetical protein